MDKTILFLSSIILIICLYYYSDFNNQKIAYGIIFCCLVAIAFSYSRIKHPTDSKDEYQLVEEENNYLENEDGIFKFQENGFHIMSKYNQEFILWEEILEVNHFNIPLLKREKQTGYEIITINKKYEFNDRNTIGIVKLGNKMAENLPNWQIDAPILRINNNGLEKANLFKRNYGIS